MNSSSQFLYAVFFSRSFGYWSMCIVHRDDVNKLSDKTLSFIDGSIARAEVNRLNHELAAKQAHEEITQ